MKTFYLTIALASWVSSLLAQTSIDKPDLIFKRNQTVLEARIDTLVQDAVYYHLFSQPEKGIQKLMLKDVARIRFKDGREETFEQHLELPVRETKVTRTRRQKRLKLPQSHSNDPAFTFQVGAEGLRMLGGDNWVNDDEKAAFEYGAGATAALDLHLTGHFAVSLRGGYNKWQVSRNYVENGETLFNAKTTLTQIPLHLGLKLYPFKGFYLMPEGGYHLYTFDYQDGSELSEKISGGSLAYGGSIGYEIRTGAFLMDISAKYNVLNIQDLGNGFTGMGAASYAGLRLGLGFIKRKNH
jgi:hypothetical protein